MGKRHYDDDQEEYNKLADHLEEYLDTVSTLVIIGDKPKKKIKKAKKVVKEAIENLRKGNVDEVLNEDAYNEYKNARRDLLG